MFFFRNKTQIVTAALESGQDLKGIAVLNDSAGHIFSREDWLGCLKERNNFKEISGQILKEENGNCVILTELKIGGSQINAVIKSRVDTDFLNIRRCLGNHRSRRNFEKAMFLKNIGIAGEVPLAAFWQKTNLFTTKTIYITEFVSDSVNLHWFAKRDLAEIQNQLPIKKDIAWQLAEILAQFHKNGVWHRDAKPSNFLIVKNSENAYKVVLIDLDGIRHYCGIAANSQRFRPFVNLAPLAMISKMVHRTDCLRTFNIYCNLTGLKKAERKRILRKLINGPIARRIRHLEKNART